MINLIIFNSFLDIITFENIMADLNNRFTYTNPPSNVNPVRNTVQQSNFQSVAQPYNSQIPIYSSGLNSRPQSTNNPAFLLDNRNTNTGIAARQPSININIPLNRQSNNVSYRPQTITSNRPQSTYVYQYNSPPMETSKPNFITSNEIPMKQVINRTYSNHQAEQPIVKEVKTYIPPQVRITKVFKQDPKVQVNRQSNWDEFYSTTRKSNPPPVAPPASEKSLCSPILLGIIGLLALLGLIGAIVWAATRNWHSESDSSKAFTSVDGIPMTNQYTIIQQQIIVDISKQNSTSSQTNGTKSSTLAITKTNGTTGTISNSSLAVTSANTSGVAPKLTPITEVQPLGTIPLSGKVGNTETMTTSTTPSSTISASNGTTTSISTNVAASPQLTPLNTSSTSPVTTNIPNNIGIQYPPDYKGHKHNQAKEHSRNKLHKLHEY